MKLWQKLADWCKTERAVRWIGQEGDPCCAWCMKPVYKWLEWHGWHHADLSPLCGPDPGVFQKVSNQNNPSQQESICKAPVFQ